MKKLFTVIMFIISCVVDVYGLVLMINQIKIDKVFLSVAIISNLLLVCLVILLVIDRLNYKRLGNISVDNIDLTVISQKNLNRKKIKGFEINTVEYKYVFSNNGFDAYFTFGGTVNKKIGKIKGIALNFSGDSNQTINDLNAYAYDLLSDPNKTKRIFGTVNPKNGLNKEVFFKFQHSLKKNERFKYVYHYRWNNCVNSDKDYIAAIPPFNNINPNVLIFEAVFKDKTVGDFRTYSIINYKAVNEELITPELIKEGQSFSYRFTLVEKFNMAVAVFYFNEKE